jgi:hypothetical protein
MNTNLELDGELISIEQASPSDTRNTFDQDDFYPADGNYANEDGIVTMVAASAAQNTPNYYDQDNFYPADGSRRKRRRENKAIRQQLRRDRKVAKTDEIKSRSELQRGLAQEKPSDVELVKALTAPTGSTRPAALKKGGMSKNTKIAIGVGSVLILGLIVFLIVKKKK